MEQIFAGTQAAIDEEAATEFTLTGPTTIVAGKLSPPAGGVEESITTYIKTLSGDFEVLQPPIVLSYKKNADVINGSGSFKFVKTATQNAVDLGYE